MSDLAMELAVKCRQTKQALTAGQAALYGALAGAGGGAALTAMNSRRRNRWQDYLRNMLAGAATGGGLGYAGVTGWQGLSDDGKAKAVVKDLKNDPGNKPAVNAGGTKKEDVVTAGPAGPTGKASVKPWQEKFPLVAAAVGAAGTQPALRATGIYRPPIERVPGEVSPKLVAELANHDPHFDVLSSGALQTEVAREQQKQVAELAKARLSAARSGKGMPNVPQRTTTQIMASQNVTARAKALEQYIKDVSGTMSATLDELARKSNTGVFGFRHRFNPIPTGKDRGGPQAAKDFVSIFEQASGRRLKTPAAAQPIARSILAEKMRQANYTLPNKLRMALGGAAGFGALGMGASAWLSPSVPPGGVNPADTQSAIAENQAKGVVQ